MAPYPATLGVILAGGLAQRMGGDDKPLLRLQGQTLIAHIEQRLSPQCEGVILNANGDASRFAETNFPVVSDPIPDRPGPLAGILAALEWAARNRPSVRWIVSVPGDTPFIPADLVARLHGTRSALGCAVACASSKSQEHYTTGLWPVELHEDLRRALTIKGVRRVEDWARTHGLAIANWPVESSDPFFNINTPEDLITAEAMLHHAPLASTRFANNALGEKECND